MINVISLNVNVLKHRQQQLSQLIFDQKLDVVCLQEIHDFSDEQIHNLKKQVSCTSYLNANKGWTGTGILVKDRLQNFKIEHQRQRLLQTGLLISRYILNAYLILFVYMLLQTIPKENRFMTI